MEYLREGREWFRQNLAIWETLRDAGELDVENAGKPEEVAKEIAGCDAAIFSGTTPLRTHS